MSTVKGPWPNGRKPGDFETRVIPQHIEAEMGVLGSMMLNNGKIASVRAILHSPDDFYRDCHQHLYRTILDLADAGKPVDAITIADSLTTQGVYEEIGGDDLLAAVVGSVPHDANAEYYAQIVRELSARRSLLLAADSLLQRCYANDATSEELTSDALKAFGLIAEATRTWSVPELDGLPSPIPFPLDVLPLPVRRFVEEVAASIPCPVDYAAVPALSVAGVAIGRSVALRLKPSWVEEPNLWTAIVGDPGTSKTPSLKAVLAPVYRIMERELELHQIEIEAQKQRKRELDAERKKLGKGAAPEPFDDAAPVLRRVLVSDATAEALGLRLRDNPRGILLAMDELAGLVNGLNQYKSGGNDKEFYLALWSRASFPIDRKGQEGGIPIYVRSPFFGVTGGIQPDKLDAIGTTRDGKRINDGFLDRFLFAYPAPVQVRWTHITVSDQADEDWELTVRTLWGLDMKKAGCDDDPYDRPFRVDFAPDALARFVAWFDSKCETSEEADFPAEMRGPYSKIRACCARLALTLEMLSRASDPTNPYAPGDVSLASVEGAIRLSEYFESHYRRVISLITGGDKENPDSRAILTWLANRDDPTFTVRVVRDNFRKTFGGDPDRLAAALAWLEARDVIRKRSASSRAPGRPGRPCETFEVSPHYSRRSRNSRDITNSNNPKPLGQK